jgi:hypothetical protein
MRAERIAPHEGVTCDLAPIGGVPCGYFVERRQARKLTVVWLVRVAPTIQRTHVSDDFTIMVRTNNG